ncbi:MAG: cell division protein ZipA [Pseudomonadota bacterium]|nr:cell division protein ZipA [Pseudomonadota bacterium]
MDKELLRIAIIGTGLIIMLSMIISAYLKDKQAREEEEDFYSDDFDDEFEDDFDELEEELIDDVSHEKNTVPTAKKTFASQIVDVFQSTQPKSPVKPSKTHQSPAPQVKIDVEHVPTKVSPTVHQFDEIDMDPPQRPAVAPSIIQFSVITKGNDDFNGADIFHVMENLGLEYGSMQIFERIDEDRLVQFGAACMLEPGTFPRENIEAFYCPGIVFFMQIDVLEDRVAAFNDYVHTIVVFAQQMDGVILDHRRQVLTNEMVDAIRNSL